MQEENKFCEVSQDTDALFVRPNKFFCLLSTAFCPPIVYAITFISFFVYWSFSIACRDGFVLRIRKYIIIDFILIIQKIIHNLLGSFMNRSLVGIIPNHNLTPLLLLLIISEKIVSIIYLVNLNHL